MILGTGWREVRGGCIDDEMVNGRELLGSLEITACGGNQYTACDTAEGCIYCGHKELKKMDKLEPEESEGEEE